MTDSSAPSEKLHAGTISGAYGIKGWVRVHALTDPLENFLTFSAWYVKDRDRHGTQAFAPLRIEDGRRHGKGLIAKIEGVDDRTAAEQLRGTEVWVDARDLLPLEDGEFYWHQLEGLQVWACPQNQNEGCERRGESEAGAQRVEAVVKEVEASEDSEGPEAAAHGGEAPAVPATPVLLGVVDHLLETGANDVLVIAPCQGSIDQRERLIPYLPGDVVRQVDTQMGRIDVQWHPDD